MKVHKKEVLGQVSPEHWMIWSSVERNKIISRHNNHLKVKYDVSKADGYWVQCLSWIGRADSKATKEELLEDSGNVVKIVKQAKLQHWRIKGRYLRVCII